MGASVVGISVDSAETSQKLRARLNLPFALLSDADVSTAVAYGAAMEGRELAVPAVFVIRPTGVIHFEQIGERVDDRVYVMDLLRQVEAAAEHGAR